MGCDPPGIGPGEQPGIGSRWFLPIAVAAVLSVVIGVLFYFGRMFFNDPSVSAWMKKELYQIIANIFLILFIVFLLGLINPQIAKVIQSVHGLDSPCTLQQAACYYTLSVRNSMLVDTVSLAIMQSVVHLASTLELPAIPFGFVQFDLNINNFYMVLEGYFGKLIQAYALGMAEWVVKASFIQFISTLLIELFLPFGLIMRNFSVTRKAGGAIIALSLSLYFIYPAMLYMNALIVNDWFHASFKQMVNYGNAIINASGFKILKILSQFFTKKSIALNILPPYSSVFLLNLVASFARDIIAIVGVNFASSVAQSILSGGSPVPTNEVAGAAYILNKILKIILPIMSATLIIGMFAHILELFMSRMVSFLLIISIILPLVNITVTLTAAKDISRFLGSEISFASLVSLI